jgi:hypothetical protein
VVRTMIPDSLTVERLPVCVLSAGRSGTSLAAQAMNLFGVYLGEEEDLMPATEQNRHGFWENLSIYRVNEQLLGLFGGSWYRPPTLPPGWLEDPRLERLHELAIEVVSELGASGRRWGFKDPRTVVTLPFWRDVIGPMDYVICIRHPQAFIDSVQKLPLPDIEPSSTAKLWLDMNIAALNQTVGARRVFIAHDEWFENSREVALRLGTFIHGEVSRVEQGMLEAVDAIVDCGLRHDLATWDAVPGTSELESAYQQLRIIAAADCEGVEARFRQAQLVEGHRSRYQQEIDSRVG